MALTLPGGLGGTPRPNYNIAVSLPAIPLFVPEAAVKELSDLVVTTVRLIMQDVAGRVADKAPIDSGGLAQSFGADPSTQTGGIEITGTHIDVGIQGRVFSSLPHAIVMDQGRRPGFPVSRVGIDAIGLWAQRKLGLSAEEAESAKYAIANHITATGIEATEYFGKGVAEAAPTIERMFEILAAEIGRALTSPEGR